MPFLRILWPYAVYMYSRFPKVVARKRLKNATFPKVVAPLYYFLEKKIMKIYIFNSRTQYGLPALSRESQVPEDMRKPRIRTFSRKSLAAYSSRLSLIQRFRLSMLRSIVSFEKGYFQNFTYISEVGFRILLDIFFLIFRTPSL